MSHDASDPSDPQSRLALAIDFPTPKAAYDFIDHIGAPPIIYKIGFELIYAGGLPLAAELVNAGHKVFIDAKLLDIAHTIERATASIAAMGAAFLTVHATDSKTLEAAVKGRAQSPLKLLGVTILTSLSGDDLMQQGLSMTPDQIVAHRARMAQNAGFDGVICSGHEAYSLKQHCGASFLCVTPGIRLAGAATDDQSRVMTPSKALDAGADYLVVGRPITQSPDPARTLQIILDEMREVLKTRS